MPPDLREIVRDIMREIAPEMLCPPPTPISAFPRPKTPSHAHQTSFVHAGGGAMTRTPSLRTPPKDEQSLALLLALAYLGQLTLHQMSRLLCVSEGTIHRRITQDNDSLTRRGFIERLDQADYDHASGTATRTPSSWRLTDAGIAHIKHHAQFPANAIGQDEQFPARLNLIRKGTVEHDRQLAETIICLIETARERWCITGIFIRFEMKLNPFHRAPIADAVVVFSGNPTTPSDPRHPLPFTRDKPVRDEACVVFVLEMDMDTEPIATINGKAIAYGKMIYDRRWQQAWRSQFGAPFHLLWVVPTPRRRDAIGACWVAQLPRMPFSITTFSDVPQNLWHHAAHGQVQPVALFPVAACLPDIEPEPLALPAGSDDPTEAERLRTQARAQQQQREAQARAAERQRQQWEAERQRREAERQRQEAAERQRREVQFMVRPSATAPHTARFPSLVDIQIGRENQIIQCTSLWVNDTRTIRLDVPLDDPRNQQQCWWAVPAARRRETFASYRLGSVIEIILQPLPTAPTWMDTGERVWSLWSAVLTRVNDGCDEAVCIVERWCSRQIGHTEAWSITARMTIWLVLLAEFLTTMVIPMLTILVVGLLLPVLVVVPTLVGVGLLVWHSMRLALDALVHRHERLNWLAYKQQEQQHWKRVCAKPMQRKDHDQQQPTKPSRAVFDESRQAYHSFVSHRGAMRVVMNIAALVLYVLLDVWVSLGVWAQTPMLGVIPSPPIETVSPTPTMPLMPTRPTEPDPAPCGFGHVTSYRLNVRDAPSGRRVGVLQQGEVVTKQCTLPVEQDGVVWVEIVPPPGMAAPTWVAQKHLADEWR